MNLSYFIDESGNTGRDWLNKDQPFFIYGGWLVKNDRRQEIEDYLNNFLLNSQASELKSKNFFKTNDNYEKFYEFFNKMVYNLECLPFFSIVDKKFMVAAKIVETFFDYDYNPSVNQYLTNPYEIKKALASCIVEDDTILNLFAELINQATIPIVKLEEVTTKLVELFEVQDLSLVANTLKCFNTNYYQKMIDEFQVISHDGTQKNYLALPQPMLTELLKNVEIFSASIEARVSIVHDNLRGYDNVFNELVELFFNKRAPNIIGTNARTFMTSFSHLDSLIQEDSKTNILIQAADLLCGFISRSVKQFNSNQRLNENAKSIFEKLMILHDALIAENISMWQWFAPYSFDKKVFFSMGVDSNEINPHQIIKSDYHKAIKF